MQKRRQQMLSKAIHEVTDTKFLLKGICIVDF